MTFTSIDTDYEALTMTVVADFAAPIEKVWELFADPRQLERWWGPPDYPATFEQHELKPGGRAKYYMTSPDGERYHGVWNVIAVEPPRSIDLTDGFADADGTPDDNLPTATMRLRLTEQDGGTHLELVGSYATRDELQTVVEMGQEEGFRGSIEQMDALLAEGGAA